MGVMTPLDFAKQYWSLQTYLFDPEPGAVPGYPLTAGWKTLRMACYRLGKTGWDTTLWKDLSTRLGKTVNVRVKTVAGITEDVTLTPDKALSHFRQPFGGKGTPEQAQIAIQLTYRYHKTKSTPDQFVANCNFIGLDCNGFVGNYIQRAVQGLGWQQANNNVDPGPNAMIEGLLKQGDKVADIKDLKAAATYILGHCTPDGTIIDPDKDHPKNWGHVMITQPETLAQITGGLTVKVVEATAHGKSELREITYTILSSKKQARGTVFKIWRGLTDDDPMDVRISRLKI
jgi:hypothetical protein